MFSFVACSDDDDDDDDDTGTPPPPPPTLSTKLATVSSTSTWGQEGNVAFTLGEGATFGALVWPHLVDMESDSFSATADVVFSSVTGRVGAGIVALDGTAISDYAFATGGQKVRYQKAGAQNGSGWTSSSGLTSSKCAVNTKYTLRVTLAEKKLTLEILDALDNTKVLATKANNYDSWLTKGLKYYIAFGGTANEATYSNIKIKYNDNDAITIDGIDSSSLDTISVTPSTLTLQPPQTATFTVTSNNANWTVTSSARGVATAAKGTGDNANTVTVTAIADGAATITVKHGTDATLTATVAITVASFPSANDTTLAVYPAKNATDVFEDETLKITFGSAPSISATGFVSICDATTGQEVDRIWAKDETLKPVTTAKTINVKDQLIRVKGNDVLITPHYGKLENSKSYFVAIPKGTFKTGSTDFAGFANNKDTLGAWKFSTRAAKTATNTMSVGPTGTDFRTIHGALDKIGSAATGDYTLSLQAGEYYELVHFKGAAGLNLKIQGPTATGKGNDCTIKFKNSNEWNSGDDNRGVVFFNGIGDLTLENITINNATQRTQDTTTGSTQAEALYYKGTKHLAAHNCSFKSHQDTLKIGGSAGPKAWFYECYIEGDVDFIWGYADVALFEKCDLKVLNDEGRSTKEGILLVSRTVNKSATSIPKGFVIFDSTVEIEDGMTCFFARNATAGDFYDQCAVINTQFKGAGSVDSAIYKANDYTPLDSGKNVGWNDYNNTGSNLPATATRPTNANAMETALYNAEYNGRKAILNKVYNTQNSTYETVGNSVIWDVATDFSTWNPALDASTIQTQSGPENKEWTAKQFADASLAIQAGSAATTGELNGLYFDASATGAKFTKNSEQWIQANAGGIVYVPIEANNATVTFAMYSTGLSFTSPALTESATKSYSKSFSLTDATTPTGKTGNYIAVTIPKNDYIGSIKIEYEK